MKSLKGKSIIAIVLAIMLLFFTNDFELINIEKTAIVTAIAVDYDQGEYLVTAQIAVPEATDTNTENSKAEVSGKGKTVADAIKDVGDSTGWFPQLTFCNLLILGDSTKQINAIKILDYFVNTLRVQDSAVVILAEKKGQDLIKASTPLDNVSSFALQKILLKNPGFDNDNAPNDIKSFCTGYYSTASSSFLPIVKIIGVDNGSDENSESGGSSEEQGGGSSSSGGGSTGSQEGGGNKTNGKNMFESRTTALYKNGFFVGTLNEDETKAYNIVTKNIEGTTIELTDVIVDQNDDRQNGNYLLTTLRESSKLYLTVTASKIIVNIDVDMYCKISDQETDYSKITATHTTPLPKGVVDKAEQTLTQMISSMFNKSVETECDFLEILTKVYRRHHDYYSLYKKDFAKKMEARIKVKVSGQK